MMDDDFSKLSARERLAERLAPAIQAVQIPGDFNPAAEGGHHPLSVPLTTATRKALAI